MPRPCRLLLTVALLLASCGDAGPSDRVGDPANYGQIQQAATVCAAGTVIEGLDVSEYQGTINWTKVKAAGKDFAITRIGDGLYKDPTFATNWAGIKSVGMIRGSYQFFRTGIDPTQQADIVVATVGKLGAGDLPVVCDVEDPKSTVSAATYTALLHTWSDRVQQGTGKRPFIYTGRSYWDSNVATSDFSGVPLWHAQYTLASCPNISDHWTSWTMWQYRADPYPQYNIPGGTCDGISGYVDLDHFNGTVADLQKLAGSNEPPKGYLDSAGCDQIVGWAQDPDVPTESIDVHVYFNGAAGDPAAVGFPVHADVNRADLCKPLGSCTHGFTLATPLSFLDGKAHPVHAYGIDSGGKGPNPELSSSPKTLTCPVPPMPVLPATGVKRHVPDPQTMTNWKFAGTDVLVVADAQVDAFTAGPDVISTPGLVQATGDPAVYLLENKTLRHVQNPTSLAAWHFAAANIKKVTAADLAANVPGAELLLTPFLIRGSGPAVYLIDQPPPLWGENPTNDAPKSLVTGEGRTVSFQLTNRGSLTWKPDEVFLAPTGPRDRDSALCDPDTWKSCKRAVSVSASTAPGATGAFSVVLRAPLAAGSVSECFGLVYKDIAWFSDPGQMGPKDDVICVSIQITSGPLPGADAGLGGDGGRPVVGDTGPSPDTGPIVAADAGSGGEAKSGCGCAASGSSAAPMLMLALLAIARRRPARR
jgi:MYXO-CTERM domain-containing protein